MNMNGVFWNYKKKTHEVKWNERKKRLKKI